METGIVTAAWVIDQSTVGLKVKLPGAWLARRRRLAIGNGTVTWAGVRVTGPAELAGMIRNAKADVVVNLHPEMDAYGSAVNAEFKV